MSIGAVIVTYHNSPNQIDQCLKSLHQNDIYQISLISNDKNNRGFAAAANLGADKLSTDYLLFINPDAYLLPGVIPPAIRFFNQHKTIGIVGLSLCNPSLEPETNCCGSPVTSFSLITRHLTSSHPPEQPQSVGWVSGGAMIIRRRLWQQLHGFDPRFFLYWEDVDLCRRALKLNQQIFYHPHLRVIHERGASLSDSPHKTKLYDQSADKYFCKHYSKPICLSQRYLRYLYRLVSPSVD